MSYLFEHSTGHQDARRAGTLAFADEGAGNSRLLFYATPYGDTSAPPLVEMVLAKPCGEITGGQIVLQQLDPSGDLVLAAGSVVWGLWLNGDGVTVSRGTASDGAGDGPFKIEGADGTLLRAGGRCRLGTTALV